MPKGNREKKKPKQDKPKPASVASVFTQGRGDTAQSSGAKRS